MALISVAFAAEGTAGAQNLTDVAQSSFSLNFTDSDFDAELDASHDIASGAFRQFIQKVRSISADPSCSIDSIVIRSGSSPDGSFVYNQELSSKRAEYIKSVILKSASIPEDKFVITSVGEDWETFYEFTKNGSFPHSNEVLSIMESHLSYIYSKRITVRGGPEKELMDLNGGRTWKWMTANIYPEIRRRGNYARCHYTRTTQKKAAPENLSEVESAPADSIAPAVPAIVISVEIAAAPEPAPVASPEPAPANSIAPAVPAAVVPVEIAAAPEPAPVASPEPAPADSIAPAVPAAVIPVEIAAIPEPAPADSIAPIIFQEPAPCDTAAIVQPDEPAHERDTSYRSGECRIGTNLLYDVVTVANLSLEIGFGRHFALNIPVTYSPWDIRTDLKLRTLLIQPELRYYFAKDFKGHYVGIEGHYGWYNIALGGKIRYQDRDGDTPLWGGGLSYGYVLYLSKHLGFEFTVSAGYAHLVYDCFYNMENGARFTTETRDWWGPTKVGVSIFFQF